MELNLKIGKVVFHHSAKTLPESRRIEFEYYWLINSGIGSTMSDFDRHFDGFTALIAGEMLEELPEAINNIRFLFYNLINKQVNPKLLSLCCLVKEINGKEWTDFSEEGLEKMALLLDLSELQIDEILPQLKKKSMTN